MVFISPPPHAALLGILLECCWNIAEMMFEYCWNAVGILLKCCWNDVGILLEYCWNITEILNIIRISVEFYGSIIGILLEY